jgi:hypothetical protein
VSIYIHLGSIELSQLIISKKPVCCSGPVTCSLHGNMVESLLNISIPLKLVEELKTFAMGSTMRIGCEMTYCSGILLLTGQDLGYASRVILMVK